MTGPVRYEDVKNNFFGNLLKLVYEICKPQSNEGAGGSWGLGKTIYFRLGIGLVIYYSRICEKGKYQSRLAACLVENETQKDALIPHSGGVKRGIAWWGKKENPFQKTTIPEDNEQEIQRILNVFGIPSYGAKETGTTIIIPYIDEEALLSEVYAKNEPVAEKPYWVTGLRIISESQFRNGTPQDLIMLIILMARICLQASTDKRLKYLKCSPCSGMSGSSTSRHWVRRWMMTH